MHPQHLGLPADRGGALQCGAVPSGPGRAHQPGQLPEGLHRGGGAGRGRALLLLQVQDAPAGHEEAGPLEAAAHSGQCHVSLCQS